MKMFSRQTLSLEEWQLGEELISWMMKGVYEGSISGEKMEPCQGDQEWARYLEIITITYSNGIIIQTNIIGVQVPAKTLAFNRL